MDRQIVTSHTFYEKFADFTSQRICCGRRGFAFTLIFILTFGTLSEKVTLEQKGNSPNWYCPTLEMFVVPRNPFGK